MLAGPNGWAIAGWEQLTLNLSAGAVGLRNVLGCSTPAAHRSARTTECFYRLDSSGAPAAEWDGPGVIHQESVGGRFETDGSFRVTRSHSHAMVSGGDEEPQWESTRLEPSETDVAALRILVAEMMRRGS